MITSFWTDRWTDRQMDVRRDRQPDAMTGDNTRRRRWRPRVITIQVSGCSSHLHPCRISAQFRSQDSLLNSIKVTSQLHPGLKDWISALSKSHLNAIQISTFASHLHPGPASPAFKAQYSCDTPIHMPSKFHIGTNIRISPSSMSRPTRFQYSHLTTIQAVYHFNLGHDNWISDPS